MTKVNEGATGDIKGIVPAIRVLVLPRPLDPLEDLEEGLELDLAVSQVDILEATFSPLTPALQLDKNSNFIRQGDRERLK